MAMLKTMKIADAAVKGWQRWFAPAVRLDELFFCDLSSVFLQRCLHHPVMRIFSTDFFFLFLGSFYLWLLNPPKTFLYHLISPVSILYVSLMCPLSSFWPFHFCPLDCSLQQILPQRENFFLEFFTCINPSILF